MNQQIVLVGIGGQGVLLATKVVGEVAMARDIPVIGSETHGMSQRGGSVTSHLRLGEFAGPIVRRGDADVLLGFNRDETLRGLPFIRAGGKIVTNLRAGETFPDEVKELLERHGIALHTLDATAQAVGLGMPRLANLVLIGASIGWGVLPFSLDEVLSALPRAVPERFLEANRAALKVGVEVGAG